MIVMKAASAVVLGLGIVLLSGCGEGADKASQSVRNFSLKPYEGRTVSPDSIEGTWVSVRKGVGLVEYEGIKVNIEAESKEYFVIRASNSLYSMISCESGAREIYVNDGQITIEGVTASLADNQKISGTKNFPRGFGGEGGSYTEEFAMVKISDSDDEVGTLSMTEAGNQSTTENVFCMKESMVDVTTDGLEKVSSSMFQAGLVSSPKLHLTKNTGRNSFTFILAKNFVFNSKDSHSVGFTENSKSNTENNISFYGSNNVADLTGTIKIQLPLQ